MRARNGVPPSNWWQRASKGQTYGISLAFSAVLFLLLISFDQLKGFEAEVPTVLIDLFVSLVCGSLLLKTVRDSQARYRAVLQRLEMIADINHHIRNALELIQLSAHSTNNAELIRNIDEAAARIQWVLREILPQASVAAQELEPHIASGKSEPRSSPGI